MPGSCSFAIVSLIFLTSGAVVFVKIEFLTLAAQCRPGMAMFVTLCLLCCSAGFQSIAAAVEPMAALEALKNHLEQNGVVGTFEPQTFAPQSGQLDRPEGELAYGIYSDAVGGRIKNMVCFLHLFDTAAHAKAYADLGGKPEANGQGTIPNRYSNGRFAVNEGSGQWPGNKKIPEALASFNAAKVAPEPTTGGLGSLIKYGPAYVVMALLIGLGLFIVCRPHGWPGGSSV